MSKHQLPTILSLQTWALEQRDRGRRGIRAIRTAAAIWRELGHPEFAGALESALD